MGEGDELGPLRSHLIVADERGTRAAFQKRFERRPYRPLADVTSSSVDPLSVLNDIAAAQRLFHQSLRDPSYPMVFFYLWPEYAGEGLKFLVRILYMQSSELERCMPSPEFAGKINSRKAKAVAIWE
jgi:hypothetical protein